MGLLVGIDEAGLGPLLGPLVATATVFEVPDEHLQTNLWDLLPRSVTPRLDRRDRRLPILDSKKLYAGRKSITPLERATLIPLTAARRDVRSWRRLLDLVAPRGWDEINRCDWYAASDFSLPLDDETGDIPTRANPLRQECAARQVNLVLAMSEILMEEDYNRLIERMRNKSRVVLDGVLRLIDRALRVSEERRVRVVADHLGGRIYYREALMTAFPRFTLRVLEESPGRSAYRLEHPGRACDVEFVVGGEGVCMATALGGILSKYIREIMMNLYNQFWSFHVPDLKPTAGYYEDGLRFLNDIEPALKDLDIPRERLVRLK